MDLTIEQREDVRQAVMSWTQSLAYRSALAGVGPFNGGCLLTALAIQNVFGGELWALRRSDELWSPPLNPDQHMVVGFGEDWFVDGLGGRSREQMLTHWAELGMTILVPSSANYAKRSCSWYGGWGAGSAAETVEELSNLLQECISDMYFFPPHVTKAARSRGVFLHRS